jgi:hypothetical protein
MKPSHIHALLQSKIPGQSDLFVGGDISVANDPEMVFASISKICIKLSIGLATPANITSKRALLPCIDIQREDRVEEDKWERGR